MAADVHAAFLLFAIAHAAVDDVVACGDRLFMYARDECRFVRGRYGLWIDGWRGGELPFNLLFVEFRDDRSRSWRYRRLILEFRRERLHFGMEELRLPSLHADLVVLVAVERADLHSRGRIGMHLNAGLILADPARGVLDVAGIRVRSDLFECSHQPSK